MATCTHCGSTVKKLSIFNMYNLGLDKSDVIDESISVEIDEQEELFSEHIKREQLPTRGKKQTPRWLQKKLKVQYAEKSRKRRQKRKESQPDLF